MTYFHWLGIDAERAESARLNNIIRQLMIEERAKIIERMESRRVESDGFITLHPKL